MSFASSARSFAFIGTLFIAVGLQGCGGGGSRDNGAAPGPTPTFTTLSAIQSEPEGAQCAMAGLAVQAGLDTNRNGTLDPSEVSSTQYVCNLVNTTPGASGTGGRGTLVVLSTETPGAHCAAGGTKVTTGIDTNGDQTLNDSEITSTDYVCGGTSPSGSMTITGMETPGANCAYGGAIVASGRDGNSDGAIWGSEITATVYACDAAPTSSITWATVAVPTTMTSGFGYVASDPSPVVFTLPAAPAIGDMFRVTAIDSGGWVIDQQAGQRIFMSRPAEPTWPERAGTELWRGVASSADGSKLVAVVNGGNIYTSTDFGLNWTARATSETWWAVASSADGVKLTAVTFGGQIYTSADGGITWTPHESNRLWSSIASSADGTMLVTVVYGGGIYASTDSGATWTARATTRNWFAVASSSDGMALAATAYGGQVYTSTDAGVNWTARGVTRNWTSLASSSDGQKLIASVENGLLYTSTDAGLTWVARESARDWAGLASSADGRQLVAAARAGQLYTSTDSGATWTPRESARGWNALAASEDGSKVVAATYGGHIYTSVDSTTQGSGSVSGALYETIELRYLGNGNFDAIRYTGEPVLN